jgi:hypothetical protein
MPMYWLCDDDEVVVRVVIHIHQHDEVVELVDFLCVAYTN